MEKNLLSNQKSCLDCQYCDVVTSIQAAQTLTLCRFKPPTATAALVQTRDGMGWQQFTTWPQVSSQDWCSEYRAKLSS